jgi:hypothetical protein
VARITAARRRHDSGVPDDHAYRRHGAELAAALTAGRRIRHPDDDGGDR